MATQNGGEVKKDSIQPFFLRALYRFENNQFVVPVVRDGRVSSLVVMSITLEVTNGVRADIYAREPRIRDALLAVLFDHSNSGGFDGVFTESFTLKTLRVALREAARSMIGEDIKDVLVMDIVRQDVI